jgi:hypothetical protein
MSASRVSIVWPLLILAAGALWMLQALGALPNVASDLIGRGWPILLVLLGLMLLLGRRARYGNLIAVVVCVLLAGGVAVAAYNQQSSKLRTENTKSLNQPIESGIQSVKLLINTLSTEIEVTPGSAASVVGEFAGSQESVVTSDYQVDGTVGTFTFNEAQGSAIPALESVGRGKLTLRLPKGVTIERIELTGREGRVDFDATGTTIKTLSVTMSGGDLNVRLPDSPGLIADLKTGSGDAVIAVPKSIAANVALRGGGSGSPEYNQADYTLSIERVLVSKRAADPQMQISVEASGKITVQ